MTSQIPNTKFKMGELLTTLDHIYHPSLLKLRGSPSLLFLTFSSNFLFSN